MTICEAIINKDSENHELKIYEALIDGTYSAGIGFSTWKTIMNIMKILFFLRTCMKNTKNVLVFFCRIQ